MVIIWAKYSGTALIYKVEHLQNTVTERHKECTLSYSSLILRPLPRFYLAEKPRLQDKIWAEASLTEQPRNSTGANSDMSNYFN